MSKHGGYERKSPASSRLFYRELAEVGKGAVKRNRHVHTAIICYDEAIRRRNTAFESLLMLGDSWSPNTAQLDLCSGLEVETRTPQPIQRAEGLCTCQTTPRW